MLESARKIQRYTAGMTFEFVADEKTVDAVVRNFSIIGEASSRLPEDFRDSNSQIDWPRIRGFRNRIVHNYFGVDHSIVWSIIENFLPGLVADVERLPT
ncbi:MAG TPA: DUF86 domain-containing protein [Pyrinomonadaceae bacterium]|nr:DUF86 domain-containing protein [Pyrinomonadaceae bacterium]